MIAKKIVTYFLLFFVVFSVVYLVGKQIGRSADSGELEGPTNGLAIYYLHGHQRCPTCERLETLTRQVVEQRFPEAVQDGSMQLHVIDYDDRENKHFVMRYEVPVPAPTVVIQRFERGRAGEWKRLDRAYQLAVGSDDEALSRYLYREILAQQQPGAVLPPEVPPQQESPPPAGDLPAPPPPPPPEG